MNAISRKGIFWPYQPILEINELWINNHIATATQADRQISISETITQLNVKLLNLIQFTFHQELLI